MLSPLIHRRYCMRIIADTHVHVYPCYDAREVFSSAFSRLKQLGGPDAAKAILLTERFDCHFFQGLCEGRVKVQTFGISALSDGRSARVTDAGGDTLYVIAGRQIVTQERLEVLALTIDTAIPDGKPVRAVLSEIKEQGGVPVLSWAPGKWFGKRGEIVRDLIDTLSPRDFILGDTTLRPTVWPEPGLMRRASEKDFRIVAGSDPLPFAGEERRVGSYASLWNGAMDVEKPALSLKDLLWSGTVARIGARGGAVATACRLFLNAKAKKK